MKNAKRIFLFISVLLLGAVFFYKDTLLVNAAKHTVRLFEVGSTYRSGDEIDIDVIKTTYFDAYEDGYKNYERLAYERIELYLNGSSFDQINLNTDNKTFVLPQVDGHDVTWTVRFQENYEYFSDPQYYNLKGSVIFSTEYEKETELLVKCDKDDLEENEKTSCILYTYVSRNEDNIKGFETTLKSDNLKFSNETPNVFLDLNKTNNKYVLTEKNPSSQIDFSGLIQNLDVNNYIYTALMKFDAEITEKTSNKLTISTDGSSMIYTNNSKKSIIGNNVVFNTTYTEPIKEEVKGEEEVVENPKTGIFNYLLLIIPITLFVLGYSLVIKKKVFKFNK
jgi:hypothetical protein